MKQQIHKKKFKKLNCLITPELNFIEQPLSGQLAYKKHLVSQLLFPENYGVEISH